VTLGYTALDSNEELNLYV